MDAFPLDRPWELVLSAAQRETLGRHFFPGDGDEHAAGILAGVHVLPDRVRLLVREIVLAEEGVDHVAGRFGYKMVRAQFIQPLIRRSREERMVFLSAHNHLSDDFVGFSSDDLASHERGYPALLDLAKGMPVGALVFGSRAIAGDIWLPGKRRVELEKATIVGPARSILRDRPAQAKQGSDAIFDRQVRLFGEAGQALLCEAKVGIVGLGGVGSQLAELLARLGVGHFVLIDPDRADLTNLPRLVGSRRSDVVVSEAAACKRGLPARIANLLRRRKVDLARRNIVQANPSARVQGIFASLNTRLAADALLGCDFLFLAADEMVARLIFNAIVHQYFIPGVQIGARVVTDSETGAVTDAFAVSRPVLPGRGCLWCNGLIDPTRLTIDATDRAQAKRQAYGTETVAPSVVSLNALGVADAINVFQFYITGMARADLSWRRFKPLAHTSVEENPGSHPQCPECSLVDQSRMARGDAQDLPVKQQ